MPEPGWRRAPETPEPPRERERERGREREPDREPDRERERDRDRPRAHDDRTITGLSFSAARSMNPNAQSLDQRNLHRR